MRDKKGGADWLLLPVFILAGILISNGSVFADSIIGTNTVWTKAQSPIVISEVVRVRPGITLTIEPGVVIKLKENKFIATLGSLKAVGSENEPIIFTSFNDDEYGGDTNGDGDASVPKTGDWYDISFGSGSRGVLDNVIIKYGGIWKYNGADYYDSAINLFKSDTVSITNSIITNNGGGISNSQGKLSINYSSIYNNLASWTDGFRDYSIFNNGQRNNIVNAANNWWGTADGPCSWRDLIPPDLPPWEYSNIDFSALCGNRPLIDVGVVYDPWLKSDPTAEKEINPVIIVPGILGSYLNKNELGSPEVWPNIDRALLPGEDSYLYELAMNEIGYPISAATTIPTDIFRQIITQDFMDGLIDELENQGYKENENLFVFPYDWRYFIDWSAGNSPFILVKSLKEKIEEVKNQTGTEKVDIIAHSMGGLVTKQYIKYYGQASVDKFIDIATPHLGAPKAAKILMYGDDLGIKLGKFSLNQYTIKNVSQNFPSVYQLLPSKNYFSDADLKYQGYIGDIYDYDNNGVKGLLDHDESMSFLKNAGRNGYLLDASKTFHDDLDDFNPANYNIKAYNITGCGKATISRIYILNKEKSGGFEYGLDYVSGDGTVPLRSAEYLNSISTYYNTGVEHPYLPSADGVRQLVYSMLAGNEGGFNLSGYGNLRKDKNNCALNGVKITYHSPIDLHVYDENNNHLGPDENGDIEMGIPDASYDIIDGNKFVFLPKGYSYRIVGRATSAGSFNARIQDITNGEETKTVYFNEVPLSGTAAVSEMNVSDNQADYEMRLDQDGDQVFESAREPDSILNEEESKDLVKPETEIKAEGEEGNSGWFNSNVVLTFAASDNEGGAGILKTEYSLDGGETWIKYAAPVILEEEKIHLIKYQSTDRAGNIENEKENEIKIDKTGPEITIISPAKEGEYSRSDILNIEYAAADSLSGIVSGSEKIVLDGEKIGATALDLFNYRLGGHIFEIFAEDLAGNKTNAKTDFIIGANIDSSISDAERIYQEGEIYNKQVEKYLIEELEEIKKHIEKFGRQQIKRQDNFSKIIKRCEKFKSKEWCEEKLKPRFEKIVYKLDKIHERIIEKRLQAIIKQLDAFFEKDWISEKGYEIIKEDIEWLIDILQKGGEIG